MTGASLVRFEMRAWRRRPPWLLAGGTLVATAALALVAGEIALFVGPAVVAMSGPYTTFWRPDAPILARLPLGGAALHDLGFAATLRLAIIVLAGLCVRPELIPTALAAIAGAALAAPAAATVAGAILASDRARAAVREVSAGYEPPPTLFLSLLPSLAAVGVGASLYVGLPWLAPIGGAIAFLLGRRLAASTLPDALRELTAMQAVRLAHVDLSRARGLERAWGALAGEGRPVYEKDVALTRRRWPLFSLGHGAAVICLGAGALGAPLAVIAAGAGLVAVSTSLLGATLSRPPTEQPRLVETLFPHATTWRAKRLYVLWRALWPLVLGGGAVLARAPSSTNALVIGAAFLAAVAGGVIAAR
jgi:hypothetical protein